MYESQRYDPTVIWRNFQFVTEMDKKSVKSTSSVLLAVADGISSSEKAHFYLGKFHDETYKGLSSGDKQTR